MHDHDVDASEVSMVTYLQWVCLGMKRSEAVSGNWDTGQKMGDQAWTEHNKHLRYYIKENIFSYYEKQTVKNHMVEISPANDATYLG